MLSVSLRSVRSAVARVDQTHEQITDVRAVRRLIEERVFPNARRQVVDDLPLGRGGQRNLEIRLEPSRRRTVSSRVRRLRIVEIISLPLEVFEGLTVPKRVRSIQAGLPKGHYSSLSEERFTTARRP